MTIGAVYLAAGNSTRFGSNKLLYPIKGEPMFLHGLDILNQMVQEGVLDRLVAVTQYPEIMRYAASHSIPARFNPDSSRGISSSISIGLSDLTETDACLFLVADQPYLTKSSITPWLRAGLPAKRALDVSPGRVPWAIPFCFLPSIIPNCLP